MHIVNGAINYKMTYAALALGLRQECFIAASINYTKTRPIQKCQLIKVRTFFV